MNVIGGVPVVLNALLKAGFLHGDTLTISGQTMAQPLAAPPGADGPIVRECASPLHPTGGLVVLTGEIGVGNSICRISDRSYARP